MPCDNSANVLLYIYLTSSATQYINDVNLPSAALLRAASPLYSLTLHCNA